MQCAHLLGLTIAAAIFEAPKRATSRFQRKPGLVEYMNR